jgi:hypothetical protein
MRMMDLGCTKDAAKRSTHRHYKILGAYGG